MGSSRQQSCDIANLLIDVVDRNSWADAVPTLADVLDRFQEWRDSLPSGLTAEALDAVPELRGYGRGSLTASQNALGKSK
jgi:hypothetical protein